MRLKLFLLVVLVSLSFLSMIPVRHAEATTITLSRIFYTSSSDSLIYNSSISYDIAKNSPVETVAGAAGTVGQNKFGLTYYIYRQAYFFDLSSIPSSANITAATLSMYILADESDTNFNVTIQHGISTSIPHDPPISSDYYNILYTGTGGSKSTSTVSGVGYWNITLNTLGLTFLHTTVTTKLFLRSYQDRSSTPPTGYEDLVLAPREAGLNTAAKLYVSYMTTGIQYVVHGPYYEDGTVAPKYVNLSLSQPFNSTLHYGLSGVSGIATTLKINLTHVATAFSWNLTTTETNKSRVYYLRPSLTYEEIYVFIIKPTEAAYFYSFNVVMLEKLTHPFLEASIYINGEERIISRQSLSVVTTASFWFQWLSTYYIRIVCDEGSYTFGLFQAKTDLETSLVVLSSMFPIPSSGFNITVNGIRRNATLIQANYTDNQALTVWCQILIQHRTTIAGTYVTDYTYNATGNVHNLLWNSATNTTAYRVTITALRTTTETWVFDLPPSPRSRNPWHGIFDPLGSWPVDPDQLPGVIIIVAMVSIFSFANVVTGSIAGFLTACLLVLMGWLEVSGIVLSILGVIVVLFAWESWRTRKRLEALSV